MSKQSKSLKQQYSWKVWTFVALNFVIFYVTFVSGGFDIPQMKQLWEQLTSKEAATAAIVPIITVVLSGIIPSNIKAILVFWRLKDPLPGSRVFSELALQDPRVDMAVLMKKHDELPIDAIEQNQLWYKIYKSHESKITVVDAHTNFLLTRDIASISALFLILLSILAIALFSTPVIQAVYISYLLIQYVVLAVVARNYGNRFVCNVLAEESVV